MKYTGLRYSPIIIPLLLLISMIMVYSCRKTSNSTNSNSTYFRVYQEVNLFKSSVIKIDYYDVQRIVQDAAGNNYTIYWDTTVTAGIGYSMGVIKTDQNGTTIWKKTYPYNPNINSNRWDDFLCDGQNLYFLASAPYSNLDAFQLLKIDTAGNLDKTNFLANLSVPTNTIWYMNNITLSKGNIITSGVTRDKTKFVRKPFLSLFSPNGSVIWQNFNLPADTFVSNARNYDDVFIEGITEAEDGSYYCASNGDCYNITGEWDTSKLWFYHISKSGQVLSARPKIVGWRKNTNYDLTPYYYSFVEIYSIVNNQFIIVNQKVHNTNVDPTTLASLDIWRVDSTGTILDSIEVKSDYSLLLGKTIKRANGNILICGVTTKDITSPMESVLIEVSPGLNTKIKKIASKTESIAIKGINETKDGYIIGSGIIQTFGTDKNNLFIIKTNMDEH